MQRARQWLWGLGAASALWLGWTATSGNAQNPTALDVAAPELTGGPWLNTPRDAKGAARPISLASRRGKVTIVEFWTFGCHNCLANLPAYARWQKKFEKRDVEIIGIHTPETEGERDANNVVRSVKELGITYPILIDGNSENWRRWGQKWWPTTYLLDKRGRVRFRWEGELNWKGAGGEAIMARHVEELLQEPAPKSATRSSAQMKPKQGKLKTGGTKLTKVIKSEEEWKRELTPEQFNVLRKKGTERPGSSEYKSHEKGVYQCAGCGLELFSSDTRFDSGTGWPSFYQPIAGHVTEKTDADGARTEVLCARCDGHLGHVFNDGPKPTGLRYCMNGVALKFDKEAASPEGAEPAVRRAKATFGAGCFWGIEAEFRKVKGVKATAVGYLGGTMQNPSYQDVCSGQTGHAEVVQVEYDPSEVSYEELLQVFWNNHNPTTLNRQGPDIGTQYRSAIFVHDAQQEAAARASMKKLQANGRFKQPIVTEITPASTFYRAEDYHQQYLEKRGLASCHL